VTAGIAHPVLEGVGDFIQEDAGQRLGTMIAGFICAYPAG